MRGASPSRPPHTRRQAATCKHCSGRRNCTAGRPCSPRSEHRASASQPGQQTCDGHQVDQRAGEATSLAALVGCRCQMECSAARTRLSQVPFAHCPTTAGFDGQPFIPNLQTLCTPSYCAAVLRVPGQLFRSGESAAWIGGWHCLDTSPRSSASATMSNQHIVPLSRDELR